CGRIINTAVAAHGALSVLPGIPGEAAPRRPLILLTGNHTGIDRTERQSRIEHRVSQCSVTCIRLRHYLRLPTEAKVDRQVRTHTPRILSVASVLWRLQCEQSIADISLVADACVVEAIGWIDGPRADGGVSVGRRAIAS